MNNKVNGQVAEQIMVLRSKELFQEWENKPDNYTIQVIVEHFKPGYIKRVMTHLKDEGFESIDQVPLRLLQNNLLGLDNVFGLVLKDGSVINIGVDITVYSDMIESKIRKLNDFRPQLKTLGISGCLVINWEVEKLPKDWTKNDKKIMRKQILNALFSSNAWVKPLTLTL